MSVEQDWHWVERCAARHDRVPWHIYRKLPSFDRAEILANYQEHCLREGVHAKRLEDKNKKDKSGPSVSVEDWL